ncbi:MAG: cadmium-translocating P-type ATPase [Oscillospiraceae bacterium]|nr:cadmium-translocating P-type ATPase [Candidatus Ruminococcus equi]
MEKLKFDIEGMSCSACSSRIQEKVRKTAGVISADVNLLSNSMAVTIDESLISSKEIIDEVISLGYKAYIHTDSTPDKYKTQSKKKLNKLLLSLILLIVLMFFAMGHLFNLSINPYVNALIQFVLTLSIIGLNFSYFTSGFKGLFKLSPNMDSLIALGATASFLYSIFAVLLTDDFIHNIYFESAGMILTFVSIGKYFESKSKSKTTEAISKLMKLSPKQTLIEKDGRETLIDTDDIKIGDTVIVKEGYALSVDGEVISGNGYCDESALTGESMPVQKDIGNKVFCGTTLTNGYIKVKTKKIKSDTTLSKIIALVEDASNSKAPIAKVADKVSLVFVPVVIAIALVTLIVWQIISGDFGSSLSFAIAVLVISCPCALGLATPTAIMVGTGKAAEDGILIKSSSALEILSKAKNVVFDKTGTVTEGKPSVSEIVIFDGFDKNLLLKITASLERFSQHPLATAVVSKYNSDDYFEVTGFESVTSKGICGIINGVKFFVGNKEYIGITDKTDVLEDIAKTGATPLIVSNGEKILGIIAVSDTIKKTSKNAVEQLHDMGITTYMLTGDNETTAEYVKSATGIENVYAQLLPDGKEKIINDLKKSGVTVMVGDGINDSPALVSADVGIAVGAGTDIAIDCADIILVKNNLDDIVTSVKLSRAVLKNIKENLFWAFFYNVIFIPVAAGVLFLPFGIRLSPMFGTIAMSLSSICVVSNALRLRKFNPHKTKENVKMKTIIIDGMMCEHCKAHVEKALNSIDGIEATVDLENKCAYINGYADNSVLKSAVENAGYTVVEIK